MIWIGEFAIGTLKRAVLVDSVTEKPMAMPCFETVDEAESFLRYADATGVKLGPIYFAEHTLDALHTCWLRERKRAS